MGSRASAAADRAQAAAGGAPGATLAAEAPAPGGGLRSRRNSLRLGGADRGLLRACGEGCAGDRVAARGVDPKCGTPFARANEIARRVPRGGVGALIPRVQPPGARPHDPALSADGGPARAAERGGDPCLLYT